MARDILNIPVVSGECFNEDSLYRENIKLYLVGFIVGFEALKLNHQIDDDIIDALNSTESGNEYKLKYIKTRAKHEDLRGKFGQLQDKYERLLASMKELTEGADHEDPLEETEEKDEELDNEQREMYEDEIRKLKAEIETLKVTDIAPQANIKVSDGADVMEMKEQIEDLQKSLYKTQIERDILIEKVKLMRNIVEAKIREKFLSKMESE